MTKDMLLRHAVAAELLVPSAELRARQSHESSYETDVSGQTVGWCVSTT